MLYNPYSLRNKVILITGASTGIGQATAIECSKMGASVIITARNKERLDNTYGELLIEEGQCHKRIIADLTDMSDLERLISELPELDGVVSNAGILKTLPIQFINELELNEILQINTIAPILLIQRLCKKKKLKRNSSIVFTSSIAGIFAVTPGNSMYSASKSAINAFMKTVALEMASKGIRCNSVNPAMIDTKLINNLLYSSEDRERDIALYPMKRYGRPQEVAFGIIYLLSDASSWITGHALVIDGGKTLL
jgi:NAD(P)-dependent dehydrogenase (short-subunit alcohol dehydrogenase family)